MPYNPAVPKRLRTSVACDQCKASKKRCLQGNPCANCVRRNLPCTFAVPDSHSESRQSESRVTRGPSSDSEPLVYSLDLPQVLQAPLVPLLDWFFAHIASQWPVIEKADLCCSKPFTAPLLTRAVCLMSAITNPDVNATSLVPDIIESVQQCFEAHDLLFLPSVSTLQSMLLLLCCPGLARLQAPIMVTAVCRMAITLGFHRPQSDRPIIYWSCIAWARWEAYRQYVISSGSGSGGSGSGHGFSSGFGLSPRPSPGLSPGLSPSLSPDPESGSGPSRRPPAPCFDVDSALPMTGPDPSTCFGALYALLEQAEERHFQPQYSSYNNDSINKDDDDKNNDDDSDGNNNDNEDDDEDHDNEKYNASTPFTQYSPASYRSGHHSIADDLVRLTEMYLSMPLSNAQAGLRPAYPDDFRRRLPALYPFTYMMGLEL